MTPQEASAENLKGSVYMLCAMASFAVGDALMKHVSTEMPLSQILVIRGLFAITFLGILVVVRRQLRPLKTIVSAPFLMRLLGEVIATATFLTALFNMPMANASAIMQALPLTVSLGAAYFFGEAIGKHRILAIATGFCGVLLIIKPGLDGFNTYALYCVVALFGTTLRDLATRKLQSDVPSMFVAWITVITVVGFALILALFQDWQPVEFGTVAMLGVASVFLISGFIAIVSAMRIGEVGVVTPYRYSVLLFAVVIGMIFFDEYPDQLTVLGSLIIVASGIYTIYRERRAGVRAYKPGMRV